MRARRDTRNEASRVRRLSPLQALEDQSQTWGIRCHSCTGRERLPPSWQLSYKIDLLRSARGRDASFDQRIARTLLFHHSQAITMEEKAHDHPSDSQRAGAPNRGYLVCSF